MAVKNRQEERAHHPPIGEVAGKKEQVGLMFDRIAPRYDLLNHLLSLGIDRGWRRRAIDIVRERGGARDILDVATGTGDVALEAVRLKPRRVIGIDIAEEMLRVGRDKIRKAGASDIVSLQTGDAEHLPFPENSFDAVTVAFGVRNFEDLGGGLREMARVLRPGGTIVILEFSSPRRFPIKQLYGWYSRHILPRVGRAVSRDEGAYTYLPNSVAAFPDGERMVETVEAAGFRDVVCETRTFGIVSIYHGTVQ